MSASLHPEQIVAASRGIDVQAERHAFEIWWTATCPHLPMPGAASHLFGAWLASARNQKVKAA